MPTKGKVGICLPRICTQPGDGRFTVYGADGTAPIIPEKDWPERALTLVDYVWHIIYQARQKSCTGAATCGGVMVARELANQERVVLSQASIYALGNGGRDAGMAIDVALNVLQQTGANPVDLIEQYDWRGYHRGEWPEGWRESAKRFRGLEAWDCPSYEAAVSAVLSGFPVVYGTNGHAVVMIGWDSNGGHVDLNSWGTSWGNQGIGQWASRREVERQIPHYGAWALRVVVDPTEDGDLP